MAYQRTFAAIWNKRLCLSCGENVQRMMRSEEVGAPSPSEWSPIGWLPYSAACTRTGPFSEEPLDNVFGLAAPDVRAELQVDVSRVLAGMSLFDRTVALSLIENSVLETSQELGVSRATVYRSIGRLRTAFAEAGLA